MAAVVSDTPESATVATPETTETAAVPPLTATLLPFVSATSTPPMRRISLAPSATLETVRVRPMMVWPASTVDTVTPENRSAPGAASPSVKVGVPPVAARVGASFTSVTETVVVATALFTVPSLTTTCTVRFAAVGASDVLENVIARRAAVTSAALWEPVMVIALVPEPAMFAPVMVP